MQAKLIKKIEDRRNGNVLQATHDQHERDSASQMHSTIYSPRFGQGETPRVESLSLRPSRKFTKNDEQRSSKVVEKPAIPNLILKSQLQYEAMQQKAVAQLPLSVDRAGNKP